YKRFEEMYVDGLSALPGAEELLQLLHGVGIPLFVVSNKRGDYVRRQAAALKWEKYFKAVIGAQDAPQDKPSRDPIDKALWQAGLTASADVWFVGDREVDMLCAKNAGCTPVFIGEPIEAARLSVSLVFSDCQALQTLLYNRMGKKPA